MCVIIDANLASLVFSRRAEDFRPVLDWLTRGDGHLVYGGRLEEEVFRVEAARNFVLQLRRAQKASPGGDEATLTNEERSVTECGLCESDDPHVVALARVSGARTLCTRDRALQRDFRNPQLVSGPRGSVYQRPAHAHLLRHSSSCGRLVRHRRR